MTLFLSLGLYLLALLAIFAIALWFLLGARRSTINPRPGAQQLKGTHFMRTFPEDRPADKVKIVPGAVTDSEGGVIDPQPAFTYSVLSSDPSIVAVSQDNPDDPSEVTFTYVTAKKNDDGSFSSATVSATVTDADANEVTETITEDIRLIIGAAANIGPGHFEFPGDVPATT